MPRIIAIFLTLFLFLNGKAFSHAPSSGVTVTKINSSEETITSTPNYATKTITTSSSKGWTRTTGVNNLGLPTTNTLSGTGVPATSLNPTWRADGSLEAISFNQGGETHSANFHPDGRLSSLTAPGRGNILQNHSISNGIETLTLDGKSTQTALDGTSQSISGSNVIARTQNLTTTNDGYQQTITPATGAATETHYNHALAQTKKKYADQSQQTTTYAGELPQTSSLARGGSVGYSFTPDGARDLSAIHWPAIDSGVFTNAHAIPSFSHAYTYNRSGAVKTLTDPSGLRAFAYHNGRPSATAYSAGILKGYQILTATDTSGRHTGTQLQRDGATIHSLTQTYNDTSDQITLLTASSPLGTSPIIATPQRDGAGRITGYVWSNGTNTVTQTWTRGIAGRIEFAGSNVPTAPSFDYLIDPQNPAQSFDAQNRRLKCQTAGGTWTYQYDASGQLTSAVHDTLHTAHSTLATFPYQFDGIGRRADKGTANTSDLLNRTIAWTNSQNKTLTLTAHPSARVWLNGSEIQNFTGTHQATLSTTNPAGEWKPWNTLAILKGAGEGAGSPPANPLASPDAKAVKKGAIWLPPANETLTYDAAGNRQSNAQWDYGWDAKNQLVRARTKNHTTAPHAYDLTYTYDAEGRRVQKHVLEYQNGAVISEKIITFLWDDWDLLYERHQLPSGLTLLERKYLWGPDIADGEAGGAGGLLLITEIKGNSTANLIPLYDGTGHVIALTDIEKNLHASYIYGPFGEKITATGPKANTNPWRWATKYLDEETSLYYFGHRYYDPITGQWLSREPLGEEESLNLYSYCHNDPVNKVDVQGLEERVIANAEPKLFITGNTADGYYIGWATEKDGMFQAFQPTGNFYYQGPFTESQAREIQTNGGRLDLRRKGASLAFKSEQLQDSIHRLEVAKFYVANTAQAAAGVGEAAAGVLAEPVTFGVSTVVVAHGADVTSTALMRMWNGPGIDTQSNTSLAFQAIGFDRNTAEYGDSALSFVVPAAQVTNLVMKMPVSLSQLNSQTIKLVPHVNRGVRVFDQKALEALEIKATTVNPIERNFVFSNPNNPKTFIDFTKVGVDEIFVNMMRNSESFSGVGSKMFGSIFKNSQQVNRVRGLAAIDNLDVLQNGGTIFDTPFFKALKPYGFSNGRVVNSTEGLIMEVWK